jgi:hypothetical protein
VPDGESQVWEGLKVQKVCRRDHMRCGGDGVEVTHRKVPHSWAAVMLTLKRSGEMGRGPTVRRYSSRMPRWGKGVPSVHRGGTGLLGGPSAWLSLLLSSVSSSDNLTNTATTCSGRAGGGQGWDGMGGGWGLR